MTTILRPATEHLSTSDSSAHTEVLVGTTICGDSAAMLSLSNGVESLTLDDPAALRALGRALFEAAYLIEGESETALWCAECETRTLPFEVGEDTEICLACLTAITEADR